MSLIIEAEPVPLHLDSDGVTRVGKTRVTLDTVVAAFQEGATAEQIAHQYPSLALGDVYAVISYYLKRRPQVAAYLEGRRRISEEIRRQSESRFDSQSVRDLLQARRDP